MNKKTEIAILTKHLKQFMVLGASLAPELAQKLIEKGWRFNPQTDEDEILVNHFDDEFYK